MRPLPVPFRVATSVLGQARRLGRDRLDAHAQRLQARDQQRGDLAPALDVAGAGVDVHDLFQQLELLARAASAAAQTLASRCGGSAFGAPSAGPAASASTNSPSRRHPRSRALRDQARTLAEAGAGSCHGAHVPPPSRLAPGGGGTRYRGGARRRAGAADDPRRTTPHA